MSFRGSTVNQFRSRKDLQCLSVAGACLLFSSLLAYPQPSPASHSSDFDKAAALLEQRRLAEAKTAALDALEKHPASVEGYNLLGIIDASQKDSAGALEAFEKALKISPHSVKTLNNLGDLYLALKKPDLAEQEFRASLRLDPANQDGNYNLGALLMMQGKAAQAIPLFERIRPASNASSFNLVRAYFQTKRPADALRVAAELSTRSKEDVAVHFSLGALLASEKQYQAAQLEFERADALQPQTFEIVYNLGLAYLRDAQYANADLSLRRALKLKPDSVDAMYLLAQALRDESRPLDALDLLIRARKLAPQNADVIFLMAQISMSQNYFEDAIPLLESGLEIAPQRGDLLAALGESYFMAGKVDKAIEVFTKLLAVDHSARSYSFLGLSYRNLGRFDEAKQYFQHGLTLDLRNASCLFNLGFIAERQGDAAAAETYFQQTLKASPDFADALLELANMRMAAKRLPEAEQLLRRFVKVSRDPGPAYYKLAMVERSLHETAAADRDLNVFKTLSKNAPSGPYPFQHLFDYLNSRAELAPGARQQLDLNQLREEIKRHPDQPENLYLLAEANLKAGMLDDARIAVAQLDQLSGSDYRSLAGTGVLLARYRLYDDAIEHFQKALAANPNSDDVKFDLANAYFQKRLYQEALDTAREVSDEGKKDDTYLALLGDINVHMGNNATAAQIFQDAIGRNPDNDQPYLALTLLDLRAGKMDEAKQVLRQAQGRIPGSGKIYWGLGLTAALDGDSKTATEQLERAVDLMPEWPGAYSTLGVFYFETGQIAKAREVLERFRNSSASGSLDVDRILQFLDQASASGALASSKAMTVADKTQLLQLALSLADRTL